jgi:predicted transcriptional regulator
MDDTADAAVALPDLIDRAGLTPHGLAVKAAIPYVTLRRRLSNPDDLRLGEAKRIATALGLSTGDLLRALPSDPEARAA